MTTGPSGAAHAVAKETSKIANALNRMPSFPSTQYYGTAVAVTVRVGAVNVMGNTETVGSGVSLFAAAMVAVNVAVIVGVGGALLDKTWTRRASR